MLAEVAGRLRLYKDAQELLERCLELAPSFDAARHNYAVVLNRQAKPAEALPQVRAAARQGAAQSGLPEPARRRFSPISATTPIRSRSTKRYWREYPRQPKVWMSYGHALKTAGRQEDSVAAYRRAIGMEPTLGRSVLESRESQDLSLFRCRPCSRSRNALERTDLADDDRLHFEFALGKALEDEESYARVLRALRRRATPSAAACTPIARTRMTRFVNRCKAQYTAEFFASAQSARAPSARAHLHRRACRARAPRCSSRFSRATRWSKAPWSCRTFRKSRASSPARGRDGEARGAVLRGGRRARRRGAARASASGISSRPAFIARPTRRSSSTRCRTIGCTSGFIHLILPNARIIDARRHPLGCCFSAFKQHFARGQNFSYDLADLGRYYRDYVDLMAHVDAVLPGRVHRVFYESMIEDTEAEVRRLLDYCGLPFEERCLQFLRERAGGAHREFRTGAPAHFQGGHGSLAALRAVARAAEAGAGAGARMLSGGAGFLASI